MILNFYEVRRGSENLDELKVASFKVFEDNNYEFRYLKQIVSEQDKNHPLGTNVRCNGVITYMTIDGNFNPGEYLKYRPAMHVWVQTQACQTCFRKLLTVWQMNLRAVRKFVQQRS